MTIRQDRIKALRASIIAASIEASRDMRNVSERGWLMIKAHSAINHRATCNRYPEVAAYWAAMR